MYLLPRFGWIIIWIILIKDFCHFALIHKGILFYLMVIYSVLILSYIKTNILLHVREDEAWNKFWRLYRSLQQSNATSSIFNDPKVMLTIHYAGNLEFRNVIPIKKKIDFVILRRLFLVHQNWHYFWINARLTKTRTPNSSLFQII